jgi:hypothetical protein
LFAECKVICRRRIAMSLSSTVIYRENRERFPLEELVKYEGKWVAFSADGRRIVADAASIAELAVQLSAARQNMKDVVLEHIAIDSMEVNLGGADLM